MCSFLISLKPSDRSVLHISSPQLALNEQAAGCAALMFPLSLRPAAALTQPHSSEKISADFISFFFPPIHENSPWVRLQVFFFKIWQAEETKQIQSRIIKSV